MKLSSDSYSKARAFIQKNARDVDRALLEFHFEEGSADAVREELVEYQNSDGGFGNAIEPDLRLRASSPFATSVGLQYCTEIGLDADSEVIQRAMEYLMSTYDSKHHYWTFTFMDVNEEPHAPWWHLEEIAPPKESSWPNPSAELLGYCHRYSELVPKDLLEQMNRRGLANLESSEVIDGLYNVMCWERAYRTLPELLRSKALDKIERTFRTLGPLNLEMLGEIRIFWIAPTPESILMIRPGNAYELLEEEVRRQADDGGWWPTWKWGQYEDVWPIAEREWAGKITVHCLTTLKAFDMIKGI
ncbi:MAG: hypothetical protein ACFFB7_01065 [Candidatus Sifarchaeia archaeon]